MRFGVVYIRQSLLIYRSRDEEIRDNIVALGDFIKQLYTLEWVCHVWLAIEPYIEIPLDYITSVCALFVDGLFTERVTDFIIFRVADIVDIIVGFIINQ